MHFARLATVELQLVMHLLDKLSLLRLARCCRFTLSCAASDFAFQKLSPLRVDLVLDHPVAGGVDTLIQGSLLRFSDISLRWTATQSSFVLLDFTFALVETRRVRRLSALEFADESLLWPANVLHELFSIPRVYHMQSLDSTIEMHRASRHATLLATICSSLTQLAFTVCENSFVLNTLPQCTHLQHLELRDPKNVVCNHALIGNLKACAGLRSLCLSHMSEEAAATALRACRLHRLTSLSLLDLSNVGGALDWPSLCAAMKSLTALTFKAYPGVDAAVFAAMTSPRMQLRRLHVSFVGCHRFYPGTDLHLLTDTVLQMALRRWPNVCIELSMPSEKLHGATADWRSTHAILLAMVRSCDERVTLLIERSR
jgi:hypothetical protein